jgi:hypothetical protein
MSKHKNLEAQTSLGPMLNDLKKRQTRFIPGTHPKPFLTEPADFVSRRSSEELSALQEGQLVAIPPLKRSPPVFDLAEVIGSQAIDDIQRSGQIVFHAAGDTGAGRHQDLGQVVRVMAMDYHRPNPADQPAFFLHLGDVTYNLVFGEVESKRGLYPPQFYTPYSGYPGKILAIPGNHDSNPQEDPNSIGVFQDNFCGPLPASPQALTRLLETPRRTPMYQPGVYFRLDAPFVQVLALFSNGGEDEGVIRGPIAGEDQWNFLIGQLKEIKAARAAAALTGQPRKAVLIAVHHPPFSGGGGHSGSTQMLADLEAAFAETEVTPDAVLSGHAHNYQRFTRQSAVNGQSIQVPFVVAGCGGHNITPLKPRSDRTPVRTPLRGRPIGNAPADVSLQQYFNGFGHLVVTVTPHVLTIDLIGTKTQTEDAVDSVTVDLASNTITHETSPFVHPANGEEGTTHLPRF